MASGAVSCLLPLRQSGLFFLVSFPKETRICEITLSAHKSLPLIVLTLCPFSTEVSKDVKFRYFHENDLTEREVLPQKGRRVQLNQASSKCILVQPRWKGAQHTWNTVKGEFWRKAGEHWMFAGELTFIGKHWEYWSEGYKGYVSDQRTLWWQADMMNGVIVIKDHRKQYKSVEKQGLVSLVSLLMEQTLILTKLYYYFVSLLFPSLPFSTTGFFPATFTVAMEKHLPQAVKQQKTCLRKH